MSKLIKFSCISFVLCFLSCSNDIESIPNDSSDKVIVEQVSSPEMTRCASEDSVPEKEAIYTISYKNIVFENVRLLPSFASKVASAKALGDVQHLSLKGYTKVEKDPQGRKNGDYFTCQFNKADAQKVGLKAGTYLCRDVFFIHEYDMGYADYVARAEGEYSVQNMGYLPGDKTKYGFDITQRGNILKCVTQGTLIEYALDGATLNVSYPVRSENMTFNIKYIDIINF